MQQGRLIVLSGPSGVGKSTVVAKLMANNPMLRFSVSATTRDMRPGEQNGVNYLFLTQGQFQQMIDDSALLEYAQYAGNFYGTPEKPLDEALAAGYDVLLDIEVRGALQVRARRPDAVMIFVAAPGFRELERRLTGRGDTAPEKVKIRLETARWEYQQADQYEYIVVNEHVDHCVKDLEAIIRAEHCKAAYTQVLKEEL